MIGSNGYERLKNIELYRNSWEQVSADTPSGTGKPLEEVKAEAFIYADTAEKNILSELMYNNALLPDPSYAKNFSLRDATGDTEHRDDWLADYREELTELIGSFQIRENHLSKEAQQRADYISERIQQHFN